VGTITNEAQRLGKLVESLLDFSRLGRAELQKTHVDLNRLVAEVQEQFLLETQGHAIEWRVEPLPEVLGDWNLLKQVFANFLSNAIKYTRTRPQATITVGCGTGNSEEVVVFVRDNGVGFNMKHASKLFGVFQRLHSVKEFEGNGIGRQAERQQAMFEAFTQADGCSTRQQGGAGLGLTLSKNFVDQMGGEIWVESEPGKGSTFHFTVPLGLLQILEPEDEPLADIELRGLSVLVVDDNETNRRVLAAMLRQWEMTVTTQDSALKALDALDHCALSGTLPSLALLDARMPGVDGFGLAEEIKIRFGSSLPVVLLTSAQGGGDVARCMELGIQAYLSKPIRQSELHEAIARVLIQQGTLTGELAEWSRTPACSEARECFRSADGSKRSP
jgi:two-component system, sensor histidine kinase and response regulator